MSEWIDCELGRSEWYPEASPEKDAVTAKEYADRAKESAEQAQAAQEATEAVRAVVVSAGADFSAEVVAAVDAIGAEKDGAIDAVRSAGDEEAVEAVRIIQTARDEAADGVRTVGELYEAGISAALTATVTVVRDEGTTQADAVRAEGGAQIDNVRTEGASKIAEISAAMGDVTGLAEAAQTAAAQAVNAKNEAVRALSDASAVIAAVEEGKAVAQGITQTADAAVLTIRNAVTDAAGDIASAVTAGEQTLQDYADGRADELATAGAEATAAARLATETAGRFEQDVVAINGDISEIKTSFATTTAYVTAKADSAERDAASATASASTAASVSAEAKTIALGRSRSKVFDTEAEMLAWVGLPAQAATLNVGDNLYIRAIETPDYWWDGTSAQKLETQKVDLSEYIKGSYNASTATLTISGGSYA